MQREQNIRTASLRQVVADNHTLSGLRIEQQFGMGGDIILAGSPSICEGCGSEKAPAGCSSCGM